MSACLSGLWTINPSLHQSISCMDKINDRYTVRVANGLKATRVLRLGLILSRSYQNENRIFSKPIPSLLPSTSPLSRWDATLFLLSPPKKERESSAEILLTAVPAPDSAEISAVISSSKPAPFVLHCGRNLGRFKTSNHTLPHERVAQYLRLDS